MMLHILHSLFYPTTYWENKLIPLLCFRKKVNKLCQSNLIVQIKPLNCIVNIPVIIIYDANFI